MYSLKVFIFLSAIFTSFVHAGITRTTRTSISVYWGQNSYGQSTGPYVQQSLVHYCRNPHIDIIPISFIIRINGQGGVPETNFANAGDNCTTFHGTKLLQCPQIQEDIKTCQKLGKTILLSVGGATYSEGGFSSIGNANAGAELLWKTFGPVPKSNTSEVLRPFGDAVIDGFDLDFESTVANMPAFAHKLRKYYAADTTKQYYLTAAPQCVFPDAPNGPMLNGSVYFDAIFVQFYNNPCGLQSFTPDASIQQNFNFDYWDVWAGITSRNKNIRVYIGVPASPSAAGSGYVPVKDLKRIIDYAATFHSFGGIMMWDASQAYANRGFISGVASALALEPSATRSYLTASPTVSTVPKWGQCGGIGYNGPTMCMPPMTCVNSSDYWSSCQ